MTISQRVFFLLEEQGKKQNELSKFTGISTSTISAWNKRGTNPAADTISTIADFFGVSTDYLLTGKETTSDEQVGTGNIHTGNVTNSNIIGGHDNKVSGASDNDKSNDNLNEGVYFELINYLESLSASKRRHALADLMDILEENYPL